MGYPCRGLRWGGRDRKDRTDGRLGYAMGTWRALVLAGDTPGYLCTGFVPETNADRYRGYLQGSGRVATGAGSTGIERWFAGKDRVQEAMKLLGG